MDYGLDKMDYDMDLLDYGLDLLDLLDQPGLGLSVNL
jgi:hypothetical protein